MKFIFISVCFFFNLVFVADLFAQLPNYATQEELKLSPIHSNNTTSRGIPNPPSSAVRTMAEWEEIDALLITWASYQQILSQILMYAQEECEVIVVCSDSNNVKSYLSGQGITPTNVDFIEASFNSIWSRDYGQWSAYTNDVDSLVLIDWLYNRPRPFDDVIPDIIADHLNLPVYSMTQAPYDLVHTGGNFMVDGMGTGFSSKLILDENDNGNFNLTDKSENEIDSLMHLFMGIDRFIKMDVLPYDLIHHIDMHMKLIDEETILVGEYPDGTADGPQIEANIQYIKDNFLSVFGTPFRFIRIQMPPENGLYPDAGGDYRTYTNAVFINNTILVPTYEQQYDDPALDIWRKAMPGHKIRGIDCNSIIPLSGALHCITKAVGSSDPLMVVHQPVRDIQPAGTAFDIEATIKHSSGILNAQIYYTNDTSGLYTPVNMTLSDPPNDIWSGNIPAMDGGDLVYYYIQATAVSGKQQSRPLPAPDAYWNFKVGELTSSAEIPKFETGDVYPNPASAITVIPVELKQKTTLDIDIFDVLGRPVLSVYDGFAEQGKNNFFFDAADLQTGSYFIRISNDEQNVVKRVLVK